MSEREHAEDWEDYEHPDFDERARRARFAWLRRGERRKVGPTRAMLVTFQDGTRSTATFELGLDGKWSCHSTGIALRWMKGAWDPAWIKAELAARGARWRWIVEVFQVRPGRKAGQETFRLGV